MGSYVNPIVQSVPLAPNITIPSSVDKITPVSVTPRMRAGAFWMQDRQYHMFARKATCYLSDLTWYVYNISSAPIPGTETVLVRGIDISGTTQYFFNGRELWVNGGAFIHPGIKWGVVDQDYGLNAWDARDTYIPSDSISIDYNYYDYTTGTLSLAAGIFVDGAVPGIDVVPDSTGAWADAWTVTIPTATASAVSATLDVSTQTITLTNWTTGVTTVQDAIDALNALDSAFTFTHDGVGSASAFLSVSVTALGGAPLSETFSGGADAANTSTNAVEVYTIADTDILYKFDTAPTTGTPIVMTDDRFYHWDSRDISPEFIVTDDNRIEFGPPRNHVSNADFEADPVFAREWTIIGTSTIKSQGSYVTDLYPRSGAHYIQLNSTATAGQTLPAWGHQEQLLSFAIAADTDPTVTVAFYDNAWVATTTDSWTATGATSDWTIFNRTYGPAGKQRVYDFNPTDDSVHAVVTITSTDNDTFVDYMYWGKAKLEPDHWQPHPLVTVEYETGEVYYEHNPAISFDPKGTAITNLFPQYPTNLSKALNYDTVGFLYLQEDCITDFRLGAGGTSIIPTGATVSSPLQWVVTEGSTTVTEIVITDDAGGFFIGGIDNKVLHVDHTGFTDWSIPIVGGAKALYFDAPEQLLYIGGTFTTVNGTARTRLAAYDWKKKIVTDWTPECADTVNYIGSAEGDRLSIAFDSVGVLVGATGGTATRDAFAVLEKSTGFVYLTFDPNTAITGGNGRYVEFDNINDIYICAGDFTTAGSDNFRTLTTSGALTAFDPSVDGAVSGVDYDKNTGIVYIVGGFANTYATARTRIAKIDVIGDTLDATFNPTLDGEGRDALLVGSILYVGGTFNDASGSVRNGTAAFDSTSGSLLDFDPGADTEALAISSGVLAVTGPYTTTNFGNFKRISFYGTYAGTESVGRRHLPYAKMNGLGKLFHDDVLQYNSRPWVREVTWCNPAPTAKSIILHDEQFCMFSGGGTLNADSAIGDSEITVTSATEDPNISDVATASYLVISEGSSRELHRLTEHDNGPTKIEGALASAYTSAGASIGILYPGLHLYIGQSRWIRGRVVDELGAPIKDIEVRLVNKLSMLDTDTRTDTTSQDGEFVLKVSANAVTTASTEQIQIEIDADSVPINVNIEVLP